MLVLDPHKRLTAAQVLDHIWFTDMPAYIDIFDEQEKDLIRRDFTVAHFDQDPTSDMVKL